MNKEKREERNRTCGAEKKGERIEKKGKRAARFLLTAHNFVVLLLSFFSFIFSFSCENPFLPAKKNQNQNRSLVEMVNIPGTTGWTVAGSSPAGGTATLTAFKMGKYEVTQEQYEEVMGYNPSYFDGTSGREPDSGEIQSKRPVERVTWFDAVEFCNKLSEREGLTPAYSITGRTPATGYPITAATVTFDSSVNGYRLPTEAQWQYAAQAGGTVEVTVNDGTGWYSANSGDRTHQVGKKEANGFGLHDMLGNVWEWCWDWYSATYPNPYGGIDPIGASSGTLRVGRGGSWGASASSARSADRGSRYPSDRLYGIGFRVARP